MAGATPSWSLLAIIAVSSTYVLRIRLQAYPDVPFVVSFAVTYGLLGISKLFWRLVIWPRLFSPLCYLPHPPNALSFVDSMALIQEEESGVQHRKWINSVPNDGLVRYLLLGGLERVFLTTPKAVSDAFVLHCYDYQRPEVAREILSRLLGFGLLLAEGDDHRVQRKNLTPAFSYRHVKDLVPTFWAFASKMARGITNDVQQQVENESPTDLQSAVIPFHTWTNRATLDIIGAAGLGFDFGSLDDPNNELSVTYREAFEFTLQEKLLQFASIFVSFKYLEYLPIHRNKVVRESAGTIRATARTMIEKKSKEISEKGHSDHKDILSIALQSGAFTVDKLVDQVLTFLAAGHETTSTAAQWAMVVLAQNQSMQMRLRKEIRDHLPSIEKNESVSSEAFDQMPYLLAFCHEVLRFSAPVPFTQREAIRDTQILGHRIPKGTNIVVLPTAMNHSKELWGADADQFNPERWLKPGCGATGGADSAYANLTFGAGPRGCIGSTFAKYEFYCLIATLIGRFEVQLHPPDRKVESETAIVSRPKDGLPLRMKVIAGW